MKPLQVNSTGTQFNNKNFSILYVKYRLSTMYKRNKNFNMSKLSDRITNTHLNRNKMNHTYTHIYIYKRNFTPSTTPNIG